MDTKFCISKIVLLALIFTLSLSSCLSGKIDPEPEPGPIVGYRTVSLHITQAPTTRVVLYGGEVQSLCEEEYDAATRGAVTERSRSASRPIPDGEFLHFRRGDLYLVTAQGVIVRHYRLIRDRRDIIEGIPYRDVDDFFSSFYDNDQERVRRLDIEDVPGQVANIVIIGNTPHNTQGNINHIGRQLLDVRSQYDAWGVNLFGETTGLTLNQATGRWEGSMYLRPGVARIEIESITGVGAITDFTLAGIFIDNVFQHTAINGEIDRNSLWSGGTTGYTFQPGRGLFTTDSNHALFDWNSSGLGVRDANNPLRLTPPQVPNYLIDNNFVAGRWAYQVFAPHDAEAARNLLGDQLADAQQPRIVLRLHNVQLRDGTTYSVRFVTLNEFADFADIEASRVFRLNVVFDERDLRAEPNAVSYLRATHPGLVFGQSGGSHITPVTVSTNVREGWVITDYPDWITGFSATRGAQGTSTFYVTTGIFAAGVPRTGVITVSSPCGRTRDNLSITQIGVGVEVAVRRRFIGAFWRNEQVGERLIRMNMNISPGTGAANNAPTNTPALTIAANAGWTATATVPWIQLCLEESPLGFPSPLTGNSDTPHLPTVAANEGLMIHGTGSQINFRIGLRSTNPNPIDPAVSTNWEPNWRQPRYGQVVITYYNNTRVHIIWVRQGEGSDFLMRPGDPFTALNYAGTAVHSTGVRSADVPRRWSPFNLTAYHLNENVGTRANQVNPAWGNPSTTAQNRSRFTRYPTQAGALFAWAHGGTWIRRAQAPTGTITSPATGDNRLEGNAAFWHLSHVNHESCPPGWRRPHAGAINMSPTNNVGVTWNHGTAAFNINASVHNSEMHMSLLLHTRRHNHSGQGGTMFPVTANALFGYYADGFFDRRTPANPPNNTDALAAQSAVAQDDAAAIAFQGMLLFNPYSGASLFFPATGRRSLGGNTFHGAGTDVHYWSSTISWNTGGSANNAGFRAWNMRGGARTFPTPAIVMNAAWMDAWANRADAMPIRCVREVN